MLRERALGPVCVLAGERRNNQVTGGCLLIYYLYTSVMANGDSLLEVAMNNRKGTMKKALIVAAILVMLLAGCGAETEKVDGTGPSNRKKVENPAPHIEDKYAAEDVANSAAANDEVTLEVLKKMSGDYATLLGNCQLIKYQRENGAAAMKRWIDDVVEERASAPSGGVVSVQEAMIKEGYSCTFQEMTRVAASGTLRKQ